MRIGVALPSHIDEAGEYLADARALEAAGADSIWADRTAGEPGHDPWMLLAAIAAVTSQVRLGLQLVPADREDRELLAQRIATLDRLTRGRMIISAADESSLDQQWVRVPLPDSRDAWRAALRAAADAGATGVLVPFGPRLLDMLRRPDEEDDRSDLLVAQG